MDELDRQLAAWRAATEGLHASGALRARLASAALTSGVGLAVTRSTWGLRAWGTGGVVAVAVAGAVALWGARTGSQELESEVAAGVPQASGAAAAPHGADGVTLPESPRVAFRVPTLAGADAGGWAPVQPERSTAQVSPAFPSPTLPVPSPAVPPTLPSAPATRRAGAECQRDGIQLFPAPGSLIPTNTRFILEGVGPHQPEVLALVGEEVTFRTSDDIILAKVLKGWRSEMSRVAVIIVPAHKFLPNRTYTLRLGGGRTNTPVLGSTGENLAWNVGATADERPPQWLRKPAATEEEYSFENGKLSRFVWLDVELEEQSPAYLVVTLQRSHGSTAPQTYFVPVHDGKAALGHDSCSGGFMFEDGKAYRATILGYDIAGNLASNVPPVELMAPKPARP
jgi:hypothetical protein